MSHNKKALRTLILTSSTGGGHNARAYAIRDWMEKLYGDSVDVKVEKLLENSSVVGKFGVGLFNLIDIVFPFVHYVYWFFVEFAGQLNRWNLLFGRKYYKDLLEEFRPQLVISVHDFLNLGYFEYARKILGKDEVRCVTYCGEFSGGFGYSVNWVNPSADLYISRNSNARKFAHKLGIHPSKSLIFFSLLPPQCYEDVFSENDKKLFIEENLGLDLTKFTVFLATNTNGQNKHVAFLNVLKKFSDNVQAIVICGRNEKVYQEVKAWKAKNPKFSIFLEGYSHQVPKLMQVSDVIVTRGGANTAAKALFYQCPMLFLDCTKRKMPQEGINKRFFIDNQAAYSVKTTKDLRRIISSWKSFGSDYQRTKANLKGLLPQNESPEDFFQRLYDLGKEVSPDKAPAPTTQSLESSVS